LRHLWGVGFKIYVQLLEYLSKIYNWQVENEKELNVIIPFVFYHGEQGWDLGLEFLESFTKNSIPENLLQFIPNFSIHLLELESKGKAFQTKNLALRLYMRLIQTIRNDPQEFVKNLKDILNSLLGEKEDAKRIEILKNLYEYIFRARKDAEDFSKQAIIKEIEGDYMNMLERIREESKLKGELVGEQRGELKKALETARNMKNLGLSMEVIIKSSDRLNKRLAVFCRHIVLLLTLLCQHKGSVTTSALVIVIIHLVSISKKSVGSAQGLFPSASSLSRLF
jgi:predicted transposase/invertase (TIGR01784 family)